MEIPSAITVIVNYGSKYLGFLLRKYWTQERLSASVEIDTRSSGDQMTIHGGEMPHVDVWLKIRNLAPFEIILDKVSVEVSSASHIGKMWRHDRVTVATKSSCEFQVTGLENLKLINKLNRNGTLGHLEKFETGQHVAYKINMIELPSLPK